MSPYVHPTDAQQTQNTAVTHERTNATSYALYWDHQAPLSATSWITNVEVTSNTVAGPMSPLQSIGASTSASTIKHTFSCVPAGKLWTSVSLYSSGKRIRFKGAGYYFACDEPSGGWSLEDDLYNSMFFKGWMLVFLLGQFVGLTYLALLL